MKQELYKDKFENLDKAQHEFCLHHCRADICDCPGEEGRATCMACLSRIQKWLFSPIPRQFHLKYRLPSGKLAYALNYGNSFKEIEDDFRHGLCKDCELIQISLEPIPRTEE